MNIRDLVIIIAGLFFALNVMSFCTVAGNLTDTRSPIDAEDSGDTGPVSEETGRVTEGTDLQSEPYNLIIGLVLHGMHHAVEHSIEDTDPEAGNP